jgi:hypothetical protein
MLRCCVLPLLGLGRLAIRSSAPTGPLPVSSMNAPGHMTTGLTLRPWSRGVLSHYKGHLSRLRGRARWPAISVNGRTAVPDRHHVPHYCLAYECRSADHCSAATTYMFIAFSSSLVTVLAYTDHQSSWGAQPGPLQSERPAERWGRAASDDCIRNRSAGLEATPAPMPYAVRMQAKPARFEGQSRAQSEGITEEAPNAVQSQTMISTFISPLTCQTAHPGRLLSAQSDQVANGHGKATSKHGNTAVVAAEGRPCL